MREVMFTRLVSFLYELLTGQSSLQLVTSIPIYEAARVIREQQPTKMTTISDGIGGDLETIVSKSMDKDRDRRYQSAYELGQDITRFLDNEPIHARRASMVYQLKMFARRNKAVVATVVTIAIALVICNDCQRLCRDSCISGGGKGYC